MKKPKLLRSPDGNLVEYECTQVAETVAAIMVTDGDKDFWIPRSLIEETDEHGDSNITIYIPEWVAYEKGMI